MSELLMERLWAIDPAVLAGAQAAAGRGFILPRGSGEPEFELRDGVATVGLRGTLSKSGEWGCSTVAARNLFASLGVDPAINAIVMVIDSRGGAVAGTAELSDAVGEAAGRKPVLAYIEDAGLSAAYWAASRATRVYANRNALVGSIGTFSVMYDQSEQAKKEGVKVHVVRAGEFKGAGIPGTPITDAHVAEMQKTVDSLNGHFLEAVRTGRQLSGKALNAVSDGRAHVGAEAVKLGLVDAVKTLEEVLQEAKTGALKTGVPPLGNGGSSRAQSALEMWNAEVDAAVAAGTPRHVAVQKLGKQEPELRAAMLEEYNEARRRR